METLLLVYGLFLFWVLGGFDSKKQKPKEKPKSPEEELSTAITKYLSHVQKTPDQKSSQK